MHRLSRKALDKLLAKAERHRIRESTAPKPTLKFTEASFPEYPIFSGKGTRADMVAIHSDLNEARRAAAIAIDWDARAGENGQIERIRLLDGEALAAVLGVTPRWQHVAQAARVIAPWRGRWQVDRIWQAWAVDKKVRGLGPENAHMLDDACRVLDALPDAGAGEVPVRRLSAQMFRDSKYVETRLYGLLDELTREDAASSDTSLVLTRLGLIKHPQPLLLAGDATIRLREGPCAQIVPPYMGIAADHFDGLVEPELAHVLTIENLTTFNEVARAVSPSCRALVLYTGGVPSPSFRNAYRRLSADCGADTCFWHWGDIDVGGFRIAGMLATLLPDETTLQPWMMDPSKVPASSRNDNVPAPALAEMATLAKSLGWDTIAEQVKTASCTVEQEVLTLDLPF